MNPGFQFNRHRIFAIYRIEMSRFRRTLWQSLVAPVITTVIYMHRHRVVDLPHRVPVEAVM